MQLLQVVKVADENHILLGAKGKVLKIWRKDDEMLATVGFDNIKAVFPVKDLVEIKHKKTTLCKGSKVNA